MKVTFGSILLYFIVCNTAIAGTLVKDKTIKEIITGWNGEAVYVKLNESITPVESCTSIVFRMEPNTPLFKENVSFLLSAFHAQSKVSLYVDGCIGTSIHLKAVTLKRG